MNTSFNLTNNGNATGFNLVNNGLASAFIINDTNNLSTNNALVIQSNGIPTLTIDEYGNATTSGSITTNGANGTITASGNITTAKDLAVNGSNITTTSSGVATLFNTNALSLSLGGAATTVTLGATNGTTTINNAALSLPNATALDASLATASLDTLNVGGGYGNSGVTISNAGAIQAKGSLTIDSTSDLKD